MTKNQHVTCIMPFFIPFTCVALRQFYCIPSPVLFRKNKKLWNEKKKVFIYGCFSVSRDIIGGRKLHF